MKEQIKGFFGTLTGVILGSETIRQIGNTGNSLGSGIVGASQSLVGIGIIGNAAKGAKSIFKWK